MYSEEELSRLTHYAKVIVVKHNRTRHVYTVPKGLYGSFFIIESNDFEHKITLRIPKDSMGGFNDVMEKYFYFRKQEVNRIILYPEIDYI